MAYPTISDYFKLFCEVYKSEIKNSHEFNLSRDAFYGGLTVFITNYVNHIRNGDLNLVESHIVLERFLNECECFINEVKSRSTTFNESKN